jgi:hypothetical protein
MISLKSAWLSFELSAAHRTEKLVQAHHPIPTGIAEIDIALRTAFKETTYHFTASVTRSS